MRRSKGGDRPCGTQTGPKGGEDLTWRSDTTFSFDPLDQFVSPQGAAMWQNILIGLFMDVH